MIGTSACGHGRNPNAMTPVDHGGMGIFLTYVGFWKVALVSPRRQNIAIKVSRHAVSLCGESNDLVKGV
jgi:hypothetical protein